MNYFKIFRPYPETRKVIINLKNGSAFRGVVWRKASDLLVLKNTEMLASKGVRVDDKPIDGEVLVFRDEVDFVQVL